MSIAFDPLDSLPGQLEPGLTGLGWRPAWSELRARFDAAREISCLLATDSCRESFRSPGSFAGNAASALATYPASAGETAAASVALPLSASFSTPFAPTGATR